MAGRVPIYPIPPEADRSFVSGPRNPAGMRARYYLAEGAIEAEWQAAAALEGWAGLAHGAAFAALHDEAAIHAIAYLAGRPGFTRRMEVEFLRPIRLGEAVRVRAVLERSTERGAVVASEIHGPAGLASRAATEYVFADEAALRRMLGRPLSPEFEAWLRAPGPERLALALARSARLGAELAGTGPA